MPPVRIAEEETPRLILFVLDFDGTIAPRDTVDALLETFALPEWTAIENEWVAGRINSQQCMAAQIDLVRGDKATLARFLDNVAIDPSFPAFVRYVSRFAEVAIVSDGVDYPIVRAMERAGLQVPVYANALELREQGLAISFPYLDADCSVGSGVCKCAISRRLDGKGETFVVLVGDGRSDFCIARSAGYVFAKRGLRKFCQENRIAHTAFETFEDVLAVVQAARDEAQSKRMPEASCQFAKHYRAQSLIQ